MFDKLLFPNTSKLIKNTLSTTHHIFNSLLSVKNMANSLFCVQYILLHTPYKPC